jgi:hypothetical protein
VEARSDGVVDVRLVSILLNTHPDCPSVKSTRLFFLAPSRRRAFASRQARVEDTQHLDKRPDQAGNKRYLEEIQISRQTPVETATMASLPVVALPLDYEASLEQIKDFLQNAKPERRRAAVDVNGAAVHAEGDDDFEEEEGFNEDDDAALDLYNLDIDGEDGANGNDEEMQARRRAGRSGYKYRDAMVRARSIEGGAVYMPGR